MRRLRDTEEAIEERKREAALERFLDSYGEETRRLRRLQAEYAAGLVKEDELGDDREAVLRLEEANRELSRKEELEMGRRLRGGI